MSEFANAKPEYDDIPEITVFRGDAVPLQPSRRTAAQTHADHALNTAEALAAEAYEKVVEAIDWLGAVANVKNGDTARYVKKLIDEIAETRRVRQ